MKLLHTSAITTATAVITNMASEHSSVLRYSGGVGVVEGGAGHVDCLKSIMNSRL